MATTYVAIQTTTVTSNGTASIEFSNIPQIYTDLILKCSLRDYGSNNQFTVVFNNNTSSVYTQRNIWAENITITSQTKTPRANFYYDAIDDSTHTANVFNSFEIYIPNYTSSNYKSASTEVVSENNTAAKGIRILSADLFSSTSAITSIKINQPQSGFSQYSTATLYGIKKD